MMTPKEINYERTAHTVIEGLKKRRMEGFYCPTRQEACQKALELIQAGRGGAADIIGVNAAGLAAAEGAVIFSAISGDDREAGRCGDPDTITTSGDERGSAIASAVSGNDRGAAGCGYPDTLTTVGYGGSMTLSEIGLKDKLREDPNVILFDRDEAEDNQERQRLFRLNYSSDTFLMSSNAITMDGILVNTDGNGNRVGPLAFGPAQVIIIAGMNKVTADLDSALSRVNSIATPPNCIRLNRDTPCARTGKCAKCLGDDCVCSDIVVTRRQADVGRVKVILVGEELGY